MNANGYKVPVGVWRSIVVSMAILVMAGPDLARAQSAMLAQTGKSASPPSKPQRPTVSSEFRYRSKYVSVAGAKMAYVETGDLKGKPIVFVHGVPTGSYLWRNVLPHVEAPGRRLIAVDLMGFGRSDKAQGGNIGYFDHVNYLTMFIQTLGLQDVTLVLHDWGAAIGLNYASHHAGNVRAIAFMEGVVGPTYPRAD
jgi:haloalkane dehalogenase